MPGFFSNPLPKERNAPHRWSAEERILLCVLQRFFEPGEGSGSSSSTGHRSIAPHELRDVLVECFKDSFTGPITPVAIRAQLGEMMSTNSAEYVEVFTPEFTSAERQWADERHQIRAAARRRHIVLVPRTKDSQSSPRKAAALTGRKRLKSDRFKDLGVLGAYGPPQDSDSEDSHPISPPKTPKKSRPCVARKAIPPIPPSAKTKPPTPPSSPHEVAADLEDDNMLNQIPQPSLSTTTGSWTGCLGFRFFDNQSYTTGTPAGFRAGAFTETVITPPPDFESEAFRSAAYTHLRPMPEPSSFISIFRNFRPALHRALVSFAENKSKTAHVAFVDLEYLHRNKLGGRDRIFNAKTVVQRHGIIGYNYKTNQEYAYSGQFEVLAWGKIEPEAIVSCRPLADLRRFFEDRPPLERLLSIRGLESAKNSSAYRRVLLASDARRTRESGRLIGELLGFLGIKRQWVQYVAENIATAWYFKRNSPGSLRSRLQGAGAYNEGVWDEFIQFEARELVSKLPRSLQVTFYPPPATLDPPVNPSLAHIDAPTNESEITSKLQSAVHGPVDLGKDSGEGSVIVVKNETADEDEEDGDGPPSRCSSVTLGRGSPPIAPALPTSKPARCSTVSKLFQSNELQCPRVSDDDAFHG